MSEYRRPPTTQGICFSWLKEMEEDPEFDFFYISLDIFQHLQLHLSPITDFFY